MDLNFEHNPAAEEIRQFRGNYDFDAIEDDLVERHDEIELSINDKLNKNDINGAVERLDEHLKSAHTGRKKKFDAPTVSVTMDTVNRCFDDYLKKLSEHASEEDIKTALDRFITARKNVTSETIRLDSKKWSDALKSNDSKKFWQLVDWKGNLKKKKAVNAPSIQEFEVFFENLYKCDNQNELREILEIESDVTVPILDDPISETEIKDAWKSMKKPGFDYQLPILSILVTHFSLMLVSMMNMMFYVKYPISLALSLLSLIPKKGNLRLPKNFRGIQMMKILACLYDRVITNRLKSWFSFHIDQTAFQKLKSTLIHIFTLRILIEIAKKQNITLYIASVDIEKAFDNVPRSLLLKKLVKLGIGKCMLFALKQLYSFSICIIKFQGELSNSFKMERGVRQGAASSVLLFNCFMDDLFEHLHQKCSVEVIKVR